LDSPNPKACIFVLCGCCLAY